MPIDIPNIDNINEVNPVYRDGIAAIFKCTRDGWVELLTGARPASEENSPTYEYTPHSTESNLCEMRCTSSDEHVYWDLTDLPKMPQSQPLTAFVFERDLEGSGAARVPFGVSAMPGNAGWIMTNRDSSFPDDTGFTKAAVVGLRFSNLEAANVDTYLCTRLNSDKTVDGYTDEGSQNNSNTSSLNTTSLSRVTIGGWYKSTSTPNFRNGARSKIGPYIIVWDRSLSADQITNLAANPALLKDPTLLSPMQLYSWLYLGGAAATTKFYDLGKRLHPDFSIPDKKPLSRVEIDHSNPLTRGLWLVQIFNDRYEPISKSLGSFQSGADIDVDWGDKILKMNGSTTGPTWTGRNAPQNFTVLGEAYYTSGTVDHALFDVNDQQIVIWADTFSSQLRTSVFAGSSRVGATGGLALNQWVKWGASVNGVSNTARIYIDGELETSGGMGTNTWENHDEIAIGSNYTAAGKYTNGGYKWVYVWDRILTDEEVRSINKDPYQILKPAIPVHYFAPAAGEAVADTSKNLLLLGVG